MFQKTWPIGQGVGLFVESNEDFKIRFVEKGEDFTIREVSVGEGCLIDDSKEKP